MVKGVSAPSEKETGRGFPLALSFRSRCARLRAAASLGRPARESLHNGPLLPAKRRANSAICSSPMNTGTVCFESSRSIGSLSVPKRRDIRLQRRIAARTKPRHRRGRCSHLHPAGPAGGKTHFSVDPLRGRSFEVAAHWPGAPRGMRAREKTEPGFLSLGRGGTAPQEAYNSGRGDRVRRRITAGRDVVQ